jgi:hypothetical protein
MFVVCVNYLVLINSPNEQRNMVSGQAKPSQAGCSNKEIWCQHSQAKPSKQAATKKYGVSQAKQTAANRIRIGISTTKKEF